MRLGAVWRPQEASGVVMGRQQGIDALPQGRIAAAGVVQKSRASCRIGLRYGFGEDFLETGAVNCHISALPRENAKCGCGLFHQRPTQASGDFKYAKYGSHDSSAIWGA